MGLSIGEVGGDGGNLGARSGLNGMAGAGGADLLVEQIREIGRLRFEGGGAHVGEVVRNGVERGGVGVQAGERNKKTCHRKSPLGLFTFKLILRSTDVALSVETCP